MPVIRPLTVLCMFVLLSLALSKIFLVGVVILCVDVYARWRDYRRFKYVEWSHKLGHYFKTSWCSRGVAGCIWGEDAKVFFHQNGYRWWHITPDGFPFVFFRLKFWKSMAGL